MGAIFALLGGLPRWVYEALAVVAIAIGLYASGAYRAHEHDVIVTRKEQVIVQQKVLVTDESKEKELEALRTYRAAHPVADFGVCVANGGPPSAPQGPASATAGNLQPVPSGDSGVQPLRAGRPIGGMLEALAGRADEVSAAYRRRQELEP